MVEVRWTLQAADDFEAIANYIAADSPHYARLFVTDILAAIDRAALFPNSGRVVPETNTPDIREILLGNYRIMYRVHSEAIEILAIYHSARLLDPSQLN
jgi:plasmid stabilization system protein ParE